MTKETTSQTHKRIILFDIKESEDKDYYKTKNKIIDFVRYTLGVNLF